MNDDKQIFPGSISHVYVNVSLMSELYVDDRQLNRCGKYFSLNKNVIIIIVSYVEHPSLSTDFTYVVSSSGACGWAFASELERA